MIDWIYAVTLIGTILVLVAAFSSLLAFRFGTPLLLLFLGIGLVAGVDGVGLDFDNAGVAYFIGSLALAVILFDSGFGTPIQSFRHAAFPALTLATVGVVITALVFGLAARLLLGLGWMESILLGAIVGSTDAAAVFFLLRVGGINIRDKVRSTLEIESGSNDPMAIFLTIALVEIIAAGTALDELSWEVLLRFVLQMGLGLIAGYLGGLLIVGLVNRLNMERGLTPIFVIALSLLVFSVTGVVGGSGFLAVYVAGLHAGNRNMRSAPTLKRFQDGVSWLAQIIMFLLLGLLATPSQFPDIALAAIGLALFLIFVARPVAVWLCLLPFNFQRAETAFIAWVGLRGAVSILLAIVPLLGQLPNSQVFFNSAFIIVLVSLLVQGWTISPLARRLNLVLPPRSGPVEKVELELPGTAHHELLAYRVVADSPVARGERVPRWARPSLVIRDGQSMRYQYAGRLRAGDYVYLFISPRYPRLLDRLFASRAVVDPEDAEFFGAFPVDPSRPAGDLEAAYAPGLDEKEIEMTIGELMVDRLGGHADYGDRVALGPIELIVRDVGDNGKITAAGLSVEPVTAPPRIPVFLSLGEMRDRVAGYAAVRRARRATAGISGFRKSRLQGLASMPGIAMVRQFFKRRKDAMHGFRTLDDIDDLSGKRVLLRVDLNVPMKDGKITNMTRIERITPTIIELSDKGAKVILLSHFGRPKGAPNPEFSLAPIAQALETHLDRRVHFAADCIGEKAEKAVADMASGDILLLENTRFHAGEEKNDPAMARALAGLGDIFVNDAFSAAHRAHASTEAIAHLLPAYAGRTMQAELEALEKGLGNPRKPVLAVVGGAKISTKLDLLSNLVRKVDALVIGGGMANTFLAAGGTDVGKSLCEHDLADTARRIMKEAEEAGCAIVLPSDAVIAREFKAGAPSEVVAVDAVPPDAMILDAGPETIGAVKDWIGKADTLVWNGPLGAFEIEPFDRATVEAARYAAEQTREGKLISVAGGGDTVAALNHAEVAGDFTYVSTAGGAFLEWMEGKALPGVQALKG